MKKGSIKKATIIGLGAIGLLGIGAVGQASVDYIGQVEAIKANFDTLLGIESDDQDTIDDLNSQITTAQTAKTTAETEKATALAKVAELNEDIDDLNRALRSKDSEITIANRNTQTVENAKGALESNYATEKAQLQRQIESKAGDVTTLQEQVARLNTQISTQTATIADLNKQLGQSDTALQEKVAEVKTYTDDKVKEVQDSKTTTSSSN